MFFRVIRRFREKWTSYRSPNGEHILNWLFGLNAAEFLWKINSSVVTYATHETILIFFFFSFSFRFLLFCFFSFFTGFCLFTSVIRMYSWKYFGWMVYSIYRKNKIENMCLKSKYEIFISTIRFVFSIFFCRFFSFFFFVHSILFCLNQKLITNSSPNCSSIGLQFICYCYFIFSRFSFSFSRCVTWQFNRLSDMKIGKLELGIYFIWKQQAREQFGK